MQIHGCVRLPRSFQAFLDSLSRKERHNLKRFERRIQTDFSGRAQIRCYRQESQIENLLRDAEEVAKKTYQRGLAVGFSDSPETRETLQMAARKGTLRGCVLYLGGRPCAFMIGAEYRDTLHGSFMGFDPQFSPYSPGSLLLMHWIEEAFEPNTEQRIFQIDLGAGDARYKRAIYNHLWNESLIHIFAPTFMGLRLNLHRIVSCLLYRSGKWLAVSVGILERVKKLWRSRARNSEPEILSKPLPV
jgi:CelD/BcsL family acetyltransferase involved in cellulose biosynthesis